MARTRPSKAKLPDPPPVPVQATTTNENILTIRGKRAWKDWLDRYAAHRRVKPTAMIDVALSESAKRDGFEPPPPRL
jgi:hypothetical protein